MAADVVIAAASIERRLAGLDAIGRRADGLHRLAWTTEDAAAGEWFAAQAAEIGLIVERDLAGNLWACPDTPPPWIAVGSQLDTVAGGGRWDGALGVACAFAIAAAVDQPVAVISFADEEGARWNTPTFGSRALAGRLDVADVLARADADGVTMASALEAAGVDPARVVDAPEALARLTAFVEIHIDQSRELADAGAPIGVVSALAGRMRVAVEVDGEADHAGTTRRSERRDALAAAARLIVAAEELAYAAPPADADAAAPQATPTASSSRRPGCSSRPMRSARSRDRCASGSTHARRGSRPSTHGALRSRSWPSRSPPSAASRSASRPPRAAPACSSTRACGRRSRRLPPLTAAPGAAATGARVPQQICFAGHDAGVLAERVPAGMVLVRNPSGVSHSPAEAVDVADAAVAATAVAAALERLR